MNEKNLFTEALERIPSDISRRVDLSMSISDRIAAILKSRGMTPKELAKSMGRSDAEVSRWLGGMHNFTLATIAKIEAFLGEHILSV